MSIDPKKRLQVLLIELFQLDKTDLNFGIYRIMNLRANDVNNFINDDLPAKLNEVTEKLMSKGKSDTLAEADEARAELLNLGVEPNDTDDEIEAKFNQYGNRVPAFKENYEKYKRAKEAAHETVRTEELERDIYNDLYRFFDRYYEEGDFVSKPRAGESTFMIPYNGEETKFYWANHDQYYIKTGENFKNYVFTNSEIDDDRKTTVEFKIIEAETEVNNNQNKKGRVFIPAEDYFDWNAEERKLTLSFYYKVPTKEEKETWHNKQSVKADNKGINEKLVFTQLEKLIWETKDVFLIRLWEKERKIKNRNKEENQNEFYYQLNRYTSINSFDYFIHKDLRKFLRQELDYFLKHEIFSLNFLADDWSEEQMQKAMDNNRIRATVIHDVSLPLIEFLAEIENFQKMLYEKKKFVVESDYCITLDLIPKDVFDEVIGFLLGDAEQKQLKEWQRLGFIESLDVKAEDIKADLYLVLDTKFLSPELKFKLLSGIENLDESCGGLLINSDNWQALNLIGSKYKARVDLAFTDPPYNTDATVIIYKNGYKHSSWCSLMDSRIKASKKLFNDLSITCTTIDDYEVSNLKEILQENFSETSVIPVVIEHNHRGRTKSNFSVTHEYGLWTVKKGEDIITRLDEKSSDISRNLRRTGSGSKRSDSPSQFYGIEVDKETLEIVSVTESLWLDGAFPEHTNPKTEVIYPIDDDGIERRWYYGKKTVEDEANDTVWAKKIRGKIQIHYFQEGKDARRKSVWVGSDLDASTFGSELLNDLFGQNEFSFPKSIFAVMRWSSLNGHKTLATPCIFNFQLFFKLHWTQIAQT
jgi:adenine-specific DNA-methyltransferase